MSKKPKRTVRAPAQLGEIFVERFYVVGVALRDGNKGFYICGAGGISTATSQIDGLRPTIGTDKLQAEKWFQGAMETFKHLGDAGDLVLIEFKDGVVINMARFNGTIAITA